MTESRAITSFDVNALRQQFPLLMQPTPSGKTLVYLDHAATSQKPNVVIEALGGYYRTINSNVHRSAYALAARSTEAYEHARACAASFLGSDDAREIVFTKGTTEAINLLAHSLGERIGVGDVVVVTEMEHHANIVPWQMMVQRTGATLRVIPVLDNGELDMQAAQALIDKNCRIVSIVHASNTLGTVNDVTRICEAARAVGALSIVDGAQAVQHLEVNVAEIGCDFYVFSAHKLFGPMGLGVLFGKFDVLNSMPPYQGGGSMISTVSFTGTTYNDVPMRFEAGTPNVEAAVGTAAAINWFKNVDPEARHDHEQSILDYATNRLSAIEGLHVYGAAPNKVGIVSFNVEGIHASDIGTLLDAMGIAVRVGHHCTQPLMHRFGVTATVRASFALTTTHAEVDALVSGVTKAIGMLQ